MVVSARRHTLCRNFVGFMNINKTRERFFKKVKKTKSCWLFLGLLTQKGYGTMHLTLPNNKSKRFLAHRVVLLLKGFKINNGYVVDHICRVRNCVNPKHLRIVTHKQNAIENSYSQAAINSKKKVCLNGHPFNKENTRIRYKSNGQFKQRVCKKCRKVNNPQGLAGFIKGNEICNT